ncbi:MAG: cell division protein FtsL [Saccharospirillaceae bacterium]|nr:cell division protein FtsL [Saccharospirillaceae bacterium]MCD8530040.1 cell division protein FtsL [Saccharospirillaceae bacterium]
MNVGAAILWLAVLISASAQIGVVHWHRTLLQVWQQDDALRLQLLQEHTRLLLEKSTLTAHGRIDQQARKQLNMTEPDNVQVLSQ